MAERKKTRSRKPAMGKTAGKKTTRKTSSARRKTAATTTSPKRWSQGVTRQSSAYRSALAMQTFYINRAGKTLPKTQHERLQRAKDELRRQFHRNQF
jgi:hypothetical protein